jgi:protein O-GlcNAc transferase
MASHAERLDAVVAALGAGRHASARSDLDSLLADATLPPAQRLAALRLRARAAEMLRDLPAAFADLREVSELAPHDAKSWDDLGMLHASVGEPAQAIDALRRALALDGGRARTWNNLGSALWTTGAQADAVDAFTRATAHKPDYALAFTNLGTALRDLGQGEAAERALERAIAIEPGQASALGALAAMRQRKGRVEDAIELYKRAVLAAPQDGELCVLFARALAEADDLGGARRVFDEALRRDPSLLRARIGRSLLLPNVATDEASVDAARDAFAAGLATLEHELPAAAAPLAPAARVDALRWSNFLLAYQGRDDRPLQERYANLLASLLGDAQPGGIRKGRHGGRRPRIGFVSAFFRDGTVGRYFASWITAADRAQWEVFVYHLHTADDAMVAELRAAADTFRALPRARPREIAATIVADAPDVLVYPELGMDAVCFVLAALRLAPLQCAGWGHPVTTGHPAIDVFFTSGAMEPADADAHYRERLVRLPGIGTRYRMPVAPADATRAACGLPEDRALLLCPQSFFKIHPHDDALFVRVLKADARAALVLFTDPNPFITARYRARLVATLRGAGLDPDARLVWLPPMAHPRYLAVNSLCDAMLDTTRWSGGNTSLDAIAAGLPIVTLPGRFMRARQSAAMLRLMGIDELVARDEDDYVRLASRIAGDRSWRDQLAARMRAARGRIFDDGEPVQAFYDSLARELALR